MTTFCHKYNSNDDDDNDDDDNDGEDEEDDADTYHGFLLFQANLEDENETISLPENTASSFDDDDTDQSNVEFCNECEVPLVTFSSTKHEENVSIGRREDNCGADCESFHPSDLLSFAWQIVRGMVSTIVTTTTTKDN